MRDIELLTCCANARHWWNRGLFNGIVIWMSQVNAPSSKTCIDFERVCQAASGASAPDMYSKLQGVRVEQTRSADRF